MEMDILKHFINQNVEVLVGGTWIEGKLSPIVKGVVVLTPTERTQVFYGATSMKTDVIQAIRQVKIQSMPIGYVPPPNLDTYSTIQTQNAIHPSFSPEQRYANK